MTTKKNDAAALTDEQVDAVSGGPHYHDWGKNGTAALTDEQKEGIIDPYFLPRPPVGPCGPKFRRC